MKTCMVTGAGGFIGSNLVRELLNRGYDVKAVDNFETGRRENLNGIDDASFELHEVDIRAEEEVSGTMDGVDLLFHQAAVPSVPRSIDDPVLTTEANCLGTTNVLVEARDAGVEKAVVASSSSIYGSSQELPKREDMPVRPESPYALSKYWTEELAVEFSEFYDIDTVALRYFNVFGPRQNPESDYAAVVPKFVNLMLEGERPVIYGDGEQSRDFTYIDNAVDANLRAAESDCSGEVFNVACGERTTVNGLVDHLNDILGTDIQPVHDDPRPGDVRHSEADISKARNLLGYEPLVRVRQGLEKTVEYYR